MKEPKEEKKGTEAAGGGDGAGLFASCTFADLGLHPALCQHLQDKMGFEVPTQTQARAIPVVISGRHVLVNAATGTGKTIVYLAPIVHLLQMHEPRVQRSDGTFGPWDSAEIIASFPLDSSWIYHGRRKQGKGESQVAERILELGFGKAVEEILDLLGSRQADHVSKMGVRAKSARLLRQNLLLSATLNDKVNHLANISLENPIMIGIDCKKDSAYVVSSASVMGGDLEDHGELSTKSVENYNLPSQLVQRYVKVSCGSRLVVLLSILRSLFERETSQKIVVFFSTCDAVDFHYLLLNEFKWSPPQQEVNREQKFITCRSFHLHGNMEREDRRKAFQGFSSEKSALLLCTDVAARGLDFPKVRCIIQYDSPGEASEYVHRVGRTARLGEKGEALLFLQPVEIDYLHDLQRHGVSLTEYPFKKVLDSLSMHDQKHHEKKLMSVDTHPWVLFLQKALEILISTESKLKKLAKDTFCSWVRAYTAHRGELKRIFMVKKLHLGHVARSFGLKEQPSLVGRSHQIEAKKRKRDQKKARSSKRRKPY